MVLVTVCSDRPFASPALTGLCISRDGAPFCRLAGVSPGLPLLGTREAPSTCQMRSRTCDEVPKLSGLGSSSDYSVGHASVPWQSSTRATLGMSWSRGLWSQFSSSPDSEHRGLCLSALALHVPLRATSFCRGLLGGGRGPSFLLFLSYSAEPRSSLPLPAQKVSTLCNSKYLTFHIVFL